MTAHAMSRSVYGNIYIYIYRERERESGLMGVNQRISSECVCRPAARDAQIDENWSPVGDHFPCSREAALGAPEVPA